MIGTLTSVKPGTASNGNRYISIVIEVGGEEYKYNTFDKDLIGAAKMLNGEEVVFEDKENPKNSKYPILTVLEEADGSNPKPKAKPTAAKPHSQGNSGYSDNNDRERRITELACMKVAGTVVGGLCTGVFNNKEMPEEWAGQYMAAVIQAGNLITALTGKLVSYINRAPAEATTSGSLLEKEAPKPKKTKGKKTLFVAALIAAGYDVNSPEDQEGIKNWLDQRYSLREFSELTEEKQDDAIAAIKAGTKAGTSDSNEWY